MKIKSVYVVVNSRGEVKLRKANPGRYTNKLAYNEFAFMLSISLPDSFWGKVLPLEVNYEVPEGTEQPSIEVEGEILLPDPAPIADAQELE